MESNTLKYILQLWDQAGSSPHEVLIEENLYNKFMKFLQDEKINLDTPLYRGIQQYFDIESETMIRCTFPTSWSLDINVAYNFIEGDTNPTILKLCPGTNIRAIFNNENTYGENEMIVYPTDLTIVSKYTMIISGVEVMILEVSPTTF